MADPTRKHPAVDDAIRDALGIDRVKAITSDVCAICHQPAPPTSFKDDLSRHEYRISGLCQVCQDEVFRPDPYDE